ncbi:unnamed protein product [Symbiodinium sp. CCMP2456]|nr:unnamed protein product [Symbiodinium sp. CCMP2456]
MAGSMTSSLVWALWHVVSANVENCAKLADTPLNAGFWRPAVIMDSLDVHLGTLRAAPLNQPVHLTGLCGVGSGLQSSQFQWDHESHFGGDWIANTDRSEIAVYIGQAEPCTLTGVAIVTENTDPALRLQFEKCAGRAAIEVPLFSQKSGGMKLMPWICGVSAATKLCSQAEQMASNGTMPAPREEETLDLAPLAEAASKGVLHTNAKSTCFDALHWFVVHGGVGVDEKEWPFLEAMYKMLKLEERPTLQSDVDIEVQEVCFPSCTGTWDEAKCGPKPVSATTAPPIAAAPELVTPHPDLPEVPYTPILSKTRLGKFRQELSNPETGPWLWISLAGACLLGIFFALLCFPLFRSREPAMKPAPRVKQVEVLYPDQTTASVKLMR